MQGEVLLSCGNALVTTNDGDRPPWTEEPEGAAGRRQARRPLLAIGRSRGLDEKIFLLNSGQAPGPRQGESVRSRDETRQGVMSKKKNAEAAVTRGLCSQKEPIAPSGSASARALSAGERGAWTENFRANLRRRTNHERASQLKMTPVTPTRVRCLLSAKPVGSFPHGELQHVSRSRERSLGCSQRPASSTFCFLRGCIPTMPHSSAAASAARLELDGTSVGETPLGRSALLIPSLAAL